MGDHNQILFAMKHMTLFKPPFLEAGSQDFEGTGAKIRGTFQSMGEYLGVDMSPGVNVDVACDLSLDFQVLDQAVGGRRFRSVFCLSLLEHCQNPFAVAANLTSLLLPGGVIFVSVPFAWKYHGYPHDYWRFTPDGVRSLFPRISFDPATVFVASSVPGDMNPFDSDAGRLSLSFGRNWRSGRRSRAILGGLLKIAGQVGLGRWILGNPYVMAPTNVFMIGRLC